MIIGDAGCRCSYIAVSYSAGERGSASQYDCQSVTVTLDVCVCVCVCDCDWQRWSMVFVVNCFKFIVNMSRLASFIPNCRLSVESSLNNSLTPASAAAPAAPPPPRSVYMCVLCICETAAHCLYTNYMMLCETLAAMTLSQQLMPVYIQDLWLMLLLLLLLLLWLWFNWWLPTRQQFHLDLKPL